MGSFTTTLELISASWRVLKQDKELLIFPLLSGICCLLVMGSFVYPMIGGEPVLTESSDEEGTLGYIILFLFYFMTYFIITFFNTAVIFCAMMRMDGKNPTLAHGFAAAVERIGLIFQWAALSATVGTVLRMIENRSEMAGRFAVSLLGMAWSIASYLAVPILVVEKKGPIDALKGSASLLKRTWGQQIIGNFSFGFVFFILMLPAIGLVIWAVISLSQIMMITVIILAVVYVLILSLVQSALMSVFQAALYLYARDRNIGKTPPGFDSSLLSASISPK